MTLTILPWYTGILLALAEFFGMHHVSPTFFHSPPFSSYIATDRHTRATQQAEVHRGPESDTILLWYYRRIHSMGFIFLDHEAHTK